MRVRYNPRESGDLEANFQDFSNHETKRSIVRTPPTSFASEFPGIRPALESKCLGMCQEPANPDRLSQCNRPSPRLRSPALYCRRIATDLHGSGQFHLHRTQRQIGDQRAAPRFVQVFSELRSRKARFQFFEQFPRHDQYRAVEHPAKTGKRFANW
jgi:hypothetical protein